MPPSKGHLRIQMRCSCAAQNRLPCDLADITTAPRAFPLTDYPPALVIFSGSRDCIGRTVTRARYHG